MHKIIFLGFESAKPFLCGLKGAMYLSPNIVNLKERFYKGFAFNEGNI